MMIIICTSVISFDTTGCQYVTNGSCLARNQVKEIFKVSEL